MLKNAMLLGFISIAVSCQLGCASSETVHGPNGSSQLVQCSFGIRDCYDKAYEVCGGRYRILDSSSSTYPTSYGTSTTHSLLIECNS